MKAVKVKMKRDYYYKKKIVLYSKKIYCTQEREFLVLLGTLKFQKYSPPKECYIEQLN